MPQKQKEAYYSDSRTSFRLVLILLFFLLGDLLFSVFFVPAFAFSVCGLCGGDLLLGVFFVPAFAFGCA